MNLRPSLSAVLAASLLLSSAPALAEESSSSASSAPSSAASSDPRVERCARFSKADDYERCARLVRRMPARFFGSSSSAASSASSTDVEWQWTNLYNRMEAKIETMVKFASTMGRKFCRAQTDGNTMTSQECMLRLKTEMQSRVSALIDEAFRGDLPSSR